MIVRCLIALAVAAAAHAEVIITIDHNIDAAATPQFKFKRVPSPARDDAAANASLALVAGKLDSNSADLHALTDGRLPGVEDDPGANVFFRAGTWGGRLRIDLGAARDVRQVNTYSWHSDSRAPQLYKLYVSDGADPNFNVAPASNLDPANCGWRLIAFVDTRPKEAEGGGQYGVSISDSSGTLGSFRYLLFDCFETEGDDDWSNTFYSEIDVLARPASR